MFKLGSNFDNGSGSETRGLSDASHHQHSSMPSDYKLGPMSAAEHREKYYATVRKPMSEQQSPSTNTLERIPEYSEDIYPYATYLPNEDNLSGNPIISRYGTTNNAGTIPISASLYNPRHSMQSNKDVSLNERIAFDGIINLLTNIEWLLNPITEIWFCPITDTLNDKFCTEYGHHKTFTSKT